MEQKIGILITADASGVIAAVKEVKDQLTSLSTHMKNLKMEGIEGLGKNLQAAGAGLTKIATASGGVTKTAHAVLELATATEMLVKAQAGMKSYSSMGTPKSAAAGGTAGTPLVATQNKPARQGALFTEMGKGNASNTREAELEAARHTLPGTMAARSRQVEASVKPDKNQLSLFGPSARTPKAPVPQKSWISGFGSDMLGTGLTLGRYGIAGGAIVGAARGAKYGVKDILLGDAQERMIPTRRMYAGAGYNLTERSELEASSIKLRQAVPTAKTEDIGEIQAEVSSHFPAKQYGMKNLESISRDALILKTTGKIKSSRQAVDLLAVPTQIRLSQMSEAERKIKLGPNSDWVQKDSLRNRAVLEQAHKILPIWAQDTSDFSKHALQTLMEHGISYERAIAMLGVARQQGIRSSTIGRGARATIPDIPKWMSQLEQLPKYTPGTKVGKPPKADPTRMEHWRQYFNAHPDERFEKYGQAERAAKGRGWADPYSTIGGSKQWAGFMQAEGSENTTTDVRNITKELHGAIPEKAGGKEYGDLYTKYDSLSKSVNDASLALSNLAGTSKTLQGTYESLTKTIQDYTNKTQQEVVGARKAQEDDSKSRFDAKGMPHDIKKYNAVTKKRLEQMDEAHVPIEQQAEYIKSRTRTPQLPGRMGTISRWGNWGIAKGMDAIDWAVGHGATPDLYGENDPRNIDPNTLKRKATPYSEDAELVKDARKGFGLPAESANSLATADPSFDRFKIDLATPVSSFGGHVGDFGKWVMAATAAINKNPSGKSPQDTPSLGRGSGTR